MSAELQALEVLLADLPADRPLTVGMLQDLLRASRTSSERRRSVTDSPMPQRRCNACRTTLAECGALATDNYCCTHCAVTEQRSHG